MKGWVVLIFQSRSVPLHQAITLCCHPHISVATLPRIVLYFRYLFSRSFPLASNGEPLIRTWRRRSHV